MANGLISARPEYLKAELVWSNASPASYFAAQTIPLDLPENAVLVIEHSVHGFSTGAATGRIGYTVIRVGTEGVIQSAYLGASFRRMDARTTGLIFDNGYYVNPSGETIQHNGLNTPMRIYALKGIHPPVQVEGRARSGIISLGTLTAGQVVIQDVLFDIPFDAAPVVVTSVCNAQGARQWECYPNSSTQNGFKLVCVNHGTSNATVSVAWIAQPTRED